jgi:hypothetical protein
MLTLGDPLFLMREDRGTGRTPADKRMKGRERGKSKKNRPVLVRYFVCLFRCFFSKGDFVNFLFLCFLGSGVNSSDGFSWNYAE